jgi:5-methyltetrahydrofolate--homocysteine methyltransferase
MKNEKLIEAIISGDMAAVETLTAGMNYFQIMDHVALAMEQVGEKYETGEFFIPEMLMSADAAKAALDRAGVLLERQSARDGGEPPAIAAVIGTVRGDIHDIGKSIVISLLAAAGIEVVDLGVNVPVDAFITAVRQHNARILMMSSLTTVSLASLGKVIEKLEETGLRRNLKVLIGGAAVNEEIMKTLGADMFSNSAGGIANLFKYIKSLKTGE